MSDDFQMPMERANEARAILENAKAIVQNAVARGWAHYPPRTPAPSFEKFDNKPAFTSMPAPATPKKRVEFKFDDRSFSPPQTPAPPAPKPPVEEVAEVTPQFVDELRKMPGVQITQHKAESVIDAKSCPGCGWPRLPADRMICNHCGRQY